MRIKIDIMRCEKHGNNKRLGTVFTTLDVLKSGDMDTLVFI